MDNILPLILTVLISVVSTVILIAFKPTIIKPVLSFIVAKFGNSQGNTILDTLEVIFYELGLYCGRFIPDTEDKKEKRNQIETITTEFKDSLKK